MNETYLDKGRIKSFNDAIFSIAMTLLVLEIAIPSYTSIRDLGALGVLQNLIPSFIGFFVSFMVAAVFWVSNLRIMDCAPHIDTKLLWINIFLLMSIVLLPFSTGLYVGGFLDNGPFVVYCINLTMISFFNYWMVVYIVRLSAYTDQLDRAYGRMLRLRALNPLIFWVLSAVVSFFFPIVARFMFVLIFVFQFLIDRYYHRKVSAV